MPPYIFRAFYPDGPHVHQKAAVEAVCGDPDVKVWVAREAGEAAGFVALKLHPEDRMGEIIDSLRRV